jgi:hypothetical protein
MIKGLSSLDTRMHIMKMNKMNKWMGPERGEAKKLALSWIAVSALLFFGGLGCQPNALEKDSEVKVGNSASIIGGEEVLENSWLSKTVVAIYAKSGSLCTGALIDRNVILTAAHCVVNDSSKDEASAGRLPMKPQDLIVIFSRSIEACSDKSNQALVSTCKLSRVEEVLVHPAYFQDRRDLRGDVALIRIEGTAPDHYVSSSLASEFMDPRQAPYVAAGFGRIYGYHKDQQEPSALRTVVLSGVSDELYQKLGSFLKTLITGKMEEKGLQNTADYIELKKAPPEEVGKAVFPTAADSEVIPVDNSQGKGICAGDSGGAAFAQKLDGVYVVTGVASFVSNPLGDEPCALVGNYTSVSFHRPWIELAFQKIRSLKSLKATPFSAAN